MAAPREQIESAPAMDAGAFVVRWSLHSGVKTKTAKATYFSFDRLVDKDVEGRESLAHEFARRCLKSAP